MTKYPWADNKLKLQRAIEKANIENLSIPEKEKRVKQLYISMGGHLVELSEDNQEESMEEEKVLPEEKPAEDIEPTPEEIKEVEEEVGEVGEGTETGAL